MVFDWKDDRISTQNRAVMGGNRQLKNCTRMAIIGHMIVFMMAGMVIGYSLTVTDIDRNILLADVLSTADKTETMLHFVNETSRMWRGVDLEAMEININEFELECIDHGTLPEIKSKDTIIVSNTMIPFLRQFTGVTESFVPAVDFVTKLNPVFI